MIAECTGLNAEQILNGDAGDATGTESGFRGAVEGPGNEDISRGKNQSVVFNAVIAEILIS